jgi:two-component system, OmpR family, response regulator
MVDAGETTAIGLARALARDGYSVDTRRGGPTLAGQLGAGTYEIIVVGAGTAAGAGLCASLRTSGVLAPILVVGRGASPRDSATTLDAGADLLMVAPVDVDEFLARVRALLRRAHGHAVVRCGPLVVDRVGRRALVDGHPLVLTGREYALLAHFASRPGEIVSRADIMARAWNTRLAASSNLAEVHVARLREKLSSHAWMIETVYGAGYRMRASRK